MSAEASGLSSRVAAAAGLARLSAAEGAVTELEAAVPENLRLERLLERRVAALESAVGGLLEAEQHHGSDGDGQHGS